MDETKLNPRILNLKKLLKKKKKKHNLQQSTTIIIQQKSLHFIYLKCVQSHTNHHNYCTLQVEQFHSSYYNKIIDHENAYELKFIKMN